MDNSKIIAFRQSLVNLERELQTYLFQKIGVESELRECLGMVYALRLKVENISSSRNLPATFNDYIGELMLITQKVSRLNF